MDLLAPFYSLANYELICTGKYDALELPEKMFEPFVRDNIVRSDIIRMLFRNQGFNDLIFSAIYICDLFCIYT